MTQISQETANNLILECVDRALLDLGPETAQFAYTIAKRSFGVSREQITQNPVAFEKALQRVFGASAVVIERNVTRKLIQIFNLSENESREMSDLIPTIMGGHSELVAEIIRS
jgi:hypothetical protein